MKSIRLVLVQLFLFLFLILNSTCEKPEPTELPVVTTSEIIYLNGTTYQLIGSIVKLGTVEILEHGFVLSIKEMPTLKDSIINLGNRATLGKFSNTLSDLEPNTTYYVRSFVTTIEGTEYARELLIETLKISTVTDYDGNDYNTVVIGDQTWMAENLKVTHYSDGTPIQLIENDSIWSSFTTNVPMDIRAYCFYDNNDSLGEIYGALYTWYAAMNNQGSSYSNPSGIQGVCPSGWHLPSDAEWTQLELYLGMDPTYVDKILREMAPGVEAGKLIETGHDHWPKISNPAEVTPTNETGFTALPGKNRDVGGTFPDYWASAYFWTTTKYPKYGLILLRSLSNGSGDISRYGTNFKCGLSVRCVKD